jgi:beta-phosphoglucomutase-like phosphatase (HAD superfamily)
MAGRLPLHRRYRRKTRDLQGDRIEDLIDAETSSDDAKRSKPAPDIFPAALDRLDGVLVDRAIAVGDTPYDAEAAAKAGIRTVGLLCGRERI